jgi:hypothetical protein
MSRTGNKNDGGYTLPETLLCAVILLLLTGALAAFNWSFMKNASLSQKTLASSGALLGFDTQFADLVSRIRAPYWDAVTVLREEPEHIALGWYEGARDGVLSLSLSNGTLEAEAPGVSCTSPAGMYVRTMKLLYDDAACTVPRGVILGVDCANKSLEIIRFFGSIPLVRGAAHV